jgi:AcrR family transcriptional regulator
MNDAAHGNDARARAHGDTRARIQQVALELFAEQGYEKTSLREIAERLDVTKAALYYHFKSKEDIVASLLEDYTAQLDALIGWAAGQPRGPATCAEIVRRYAGIVACGQQTFRMLHQNQAAVHSLAAAKGRSDVFRERLSALTELMAGPGAPLPDRARAAMALGGVNICWMLLAAEGTDQAELTAAVTSIAAELAGAGQDALR